MDFLSLKQCFVGQARKCIGVACSCWRRSFQPISAAARSLVHVRNAGRGLERFKSWNGPKTVFTWSKCRLPWKRAAGTFCQTFYYFFFFIKIDVTQTTERNYSCFMQCKIVLWNTAREVGESWETNLFWFIVFSLEHQQLSTDSCVACRLFNWQFLIIKF